MDKVKLICIECPRGCEMTAEVADKKVVSVEGNFCSKGAKYAAAELTMPLRVVTTTVRLDDGRLLPVKTDKGVAKSEIFEVMKRINRLTASAPVSIGQVLARDIDGSGANVVATRRLGND